MDPATLAGLAVSAISPYVLKGAEEFAKAAGKDVYEQTKKIKEWLWKRIKHSGDKKAQQTTSMYESDPTTFKEAMTRVLLEYLEGHPQDAQELSKILQDLKTSESKYHVSVSGGTIYGVNIGDNPTLIQNFGQQDDESHN